MGARRRGRHRRARHAARRARVLQPRGAVGRRRSRCAAARRDGRLIRAAATMRLRIVALGHRMPAWVDAGVADYAKRLPRELALELVELKPAPARPRARPCAQLLADEAERVRAACAGSRIVALDERGSAWTTRELASELAHWRDEARRRRVRHRQRRRPRSAPSSARPHALRRVVRAARCRTGSCASCSPSSSTARRASIAGHPYHRE